MILFFLLIGKFNLKCMFLVFYEYNLVDLSNFIVDFFEINIVVENILFIN